MPKTRPILNEPPTPPSVPQRRRPYVIAFIVRAPARIPGMEKSLSGYKLITDASDLTGIAKTLETTEAIGVDVETGDLAPLKEVLEDGPVKALHNAKFDYAFLKSEHGITLSPIFDTMLAAQLLSGGNYEASYALEAVAERYADVELDKSARKEDWSGKLSEAQIEYAARDAAVLLPLRERLQEELEREKLVRVSEIEFGAVATLAEMEPAGLQLDVARWKEIEIAVRERRDEAAVALEAHFPEPEGVLPLEGLG